MEPLPPLDPLPAVALERIEVLTWEVPLAVPLRSAHQPQEQATRPVLLVRAVADGLEGWAECAVEPAPTYEAAFTDSARLVLAEHLAPRALAGPADLPSLAGRLAEVRGHHSATAALELAVIDLQLRAADRSLASWLGATERAVPAGATLGLHDETADLLAEADAALAAGAARLRVKVRPGPAVAAVAALVDHVAGAVPVQADANGSFRADEPDHLADLHRLDGLGLACLEQPLEPHDLLGSAALAARSSTPLCLDEPITSVRAIEAAAELAAARVVCLKPGRLGGWPAARRAQHRARELGLGAWAGGMLETDLGRAANAAFAALPGMTAAPDLDPRPRFAARLARPLTVVDGRVQVPDGPGTGVEPDLRGLGTPHVVTIR